jgi:hypothetical protein
LRRTPGASLFQSPSAALPVSKVPLSAALPFGIALLKIAAIKIVDETQTRQRFLIHVFNRFGLRDRVDGREFNALDRADMSAL